MPRRNETTSVPRMPVRPQQAPNEEGLNRFWGSGFRVEVAVAGIHARGRWVFVKLALLSEAVFWGFSKPYCFFIHWLRLARKG